MIKSPERDTLEVRMLDQLAQGMRQGMLLGYLNITVGADYENPRIRDFL